jgi:hypothetical protein
MHRGAHAADALGDGPGVARVAAEQDQFDAAPHLARGPGLLDAPAIHVDVDTQVAFDAGDRINRYALGHFSVSIPVLVSSLHCVFPRQYREATGDDDVTEDLYGEHAGGDQHFGQRREVTEAVAGFVADQDSH